MFFSHGSSPIVSECEGEYNFDQRKSQLLWMVPVVDRNTKSGALEFTAPGTPEDFFPLIVSFASRKPFADILVSWLIFVIDLHVLIYIKLQVTEVVDVDDGTPVKYSSEVLFFAEKYEIV